MPTPSNERSVTVSIFYETSDIAHESSLKRTIPSCWSVSKIDTDHLSPISDKISRIGQKNQFFPLSFTLIINITNVQVSALLKSAVLLYRYSLFTFASTKVSNFILTTKQKTMKTVEKSSLGLNYSAIELGVMATLDQYKLVFAPGVEIPGKVFIGGDLQVTGSEISFQSYAPNTETGFLHTHKSHEEVYIFVSGNGEFQVDGTVFPISEGSVVKVAPEGKRAVRNNGTVPLVMICIQYKANSFNETDATDGEILREIVKW